MHAYVATLNATVPHRRVSMLPDIHLSERAGVSHSDHLHSEVSEEINDLQRLSPQTKDQNYRSHHWTYQLL